jgi:CubicO group peptidase (beta-lactamase class C family)
MNIRPAIRLTAVLTLAAVASGTVAGFARPGAPSNTGPELPALSERLDRDVPLILEAYNVPGVAIAVVRDGQTVWSGGYGVASLDGTPMSGDTVFQVASISKTLTAWGVMHLVETGRVSLDAPVEDYLTRWEFPPSAYDPRDVTVARVLNHTAGLNRVDGYPLPAGEALPLLEESLGGDNGGGQSLRIDLEPGRQFNYSNGGYTLLQLMIEEVTGQPFAAYMQEAILDPLGMTNSTFDPDRVPGQATGHYPGGEPVQHYRLTEQAAGGLYSTANDLALLLAASVTSDGHAAGGGVLSAESVETMVARRDVPDGSMVSLGYLIDHLAGGLTTTGNNGRNVGFITNMVMIPELGEGIVILTNSYTESTGLTLRSWTQWLGVSDTATTQNALGDLEETSTIMLGIAGVVFGGGLAVIIITLVQAGRGKRRWLWRAESTSRRLLIRAGIVVIAVVGLGAFLLWPERQLYVTLLPAEATTVLVAVVLAVAAVALRASTRRGSK